MEAKQKILQLVRDRGPLLPNDIRKEIGQDNTIIGAMLSELKSNGQVAISSTKRGGSPFYYNPSTPQKLENVMSELNEKDQRAAQLLKEKVVLRDKDLDPLTRVCMRNIKDFSRPLKVKVGDTVEVFWKYYLADQSQVQTKLRSIITPGAAPEKPRPQTKTEAKTKLDSTPKESAVAVDSQPESKALPKQNIQHAPAEEVQPNTIKEPVNKPAPAVSKKKKSKSKSKDIELDTENSEGMLRDAVAVPEDDELYTKILKWADKNSITIVESNLIRKKSEIDLIVKMETNLGQVTYYVKVKGKKSSNEGDLAAALLSANVLRLPAIYLSAGKITKKAEEALNHELRGITISSFD